MTRPPRDPPQDLSMAASIQAPGAPPPPPKPAPQWRNSLRKAIPYLLAIQLGAIFIQASLGGVSIMGDYGYIGYHQSFIHVFEMLPLLVALLAFLGRDWTVGIASVVLWFMIGAQYSIRDMEGAVRGLHVVNAMVILSATLVLLMQRWPRSNAGPKTRAATSSGTPPSSAKPGK